MILRDLFPLYFKEAYEEFKHVLLAFIYDKNDQSSPVANEVGCLCYTYEFAYFLFFDIMLNLCFCYGPCFGNVLSQFYDYFSSGLKGGGLILLGYCALY